MGEYTAQRVNRCAAEHCRSFLCALSMDLPFPPSLLPSPVHHFVLQAPLAFFQFPLPCLETLCVHLCARV